MRILKTCCYKMRHYNLLPALIVLPTEQGIIIQFKIWNRHLGFEVGTIDTIDIA